MDRMKKHRRIKQEKPSASSSTNRAAEEHDLAFYIHDRVELMHQVFSVLKSKELKALAPECVRRLSISDLQELCLEELLGISSKRLCAILDGAEPPSDTESSSQSPEHLETISLDSISSDEEILSQSSKKKKHKHRHSKKKRRRSRSGSGEGRAARAGLTVLELLELQARARAIRAQLHQEPAKVPNERAPEPASSDNEVEIKEEPADVVEISSDDEKPDVAELEKRTGISAPETRTSEPNKPEESQTVTKRINDLVITVPQSKPTRKIKLKRQKPTETTTTVSTDKLTESNPAKTSTNTSKTDNVSKDTANKETVKISAETTTKPKKNKKKKKKVKDKEGSDQDEITLQLSDSEKMDLLEDLDTKNLDNVSSSGSSESESESDESVDNTNSKEVIEENNKNNELKEPEKSNENAQINVEEESNETVEVNDVSDDKIDPIEQSNATVEVIEVSNDKVDAVEETNKTVEVSNNSNVKDVNALETAIEINVKENGTNKSDKKDDSSNNVTEANMEQNVTEKQKSDGELSDRDSSEVEASDVQPEVVCISDDETKKKKKKKKEKKSKRDKDKIKNNDKAKSESNTAVEITLDEEDDDVYEILEISDDSSCYEVDGVSVLSKEPTAEEIEAFAARMDEIEIDKEETVIPTVVTETPNESDSKVDEPSDVENISWKDRYLGSKKVQRVLTTANVLNAIRKKNKELKKKLEEAKKAELDKEKEAQKNVPVEQRPIEDGSIEQYETLQGSTKYVDPVKENEEIVEKDGKEESNETVTNDMKKDAKMLMKMYKRLLKYNDINKQKDPNKKKKKKQKKNKDKEKANA